MYILFFYLHTFLYSNWYCNKSLWFHYRQKSLSSKSELSNNHHRQQQKGTAIFLIYTGSSLKLKRNPTRTNLLPPRTVKASDNYHHHTSTLNTIGPKQSTRSLQVLQSQLTNAHFPRQLKHAAIEK